MLMWEQLRARRIAEHLTQEEVGRRMGLPQNVISRIESGTTDIKESTLERYAEALGRKWVLQ